MVNDLFQRPFAFARHRSTIFGPHIDGYLEDLRKQGFCNYMLRRNLWLITRFGEFLAKVGKGKLTEVTSVTLSEFLGQEEAHFQESSRTSRRTLARRLADSHRVAESLMRRLGIHLLEEQAAAAPGFMAGFYRWLLNDRGLQAVSIARYRYFLDEFLTHLESDGSAEGLSRLTIENVDSFVTAYGRRHGRKSTSHACSAIRSLLRYLHLRGVLDRDLSRIVILPHFYALERLPCALPWETVRGILAAVDVTTPRGLRDRAILLLLVTYGVRPGEIVKLRLDDIDWRHEVVQFRRSKSGRPLSFPLLGEVGGAIIAYLRGGRPATSSRELFIRMAAPHVGFRSGATVSGLVHHCLLKAGIESRHTGAGVIRHSLAVHLLHQRHPLKVVTDMLGHRDPSVAYHYTKLGLDDLCGVALDAREVLP